MSFPRVRGLRALELGSPGSGLQRELNSLVLAGEKRATAGLLSEYADEEEELESVGEEQYLVDADGAPLALIRCTRVEVVPFADVTWEFAQAEGEGFTDIDDWRRAHRRYWLGEQGRDVGDDEQVVCLWFDVLAAGSAPEAAGRVVLLETARLVLRRFTPADVDLLVELDSDPDVVHFITGGVPSPRSQIEHEVLPAWLRYYASSDAVGYWAAEDRATGEFLGWFHLRPRADGPADELELGYRLRRSAWGRGLAPEGSRALIDLAFTQAGASRVVAECMAVHTASRRVMEKAGLTLVRTFHADWPYAIPGDAFGDVEYAIDRAEWMSRRLEVAAVVLTDDTGRIALVRKRGTQRFMLPGGKIEQGEAPEDCAVREAEEELGAHLDRERLSLLGAWGAPAANEPGHHVHGHVFAHPRVAGLSARGEIDELIWVLPEEADGRDDLAPLFEFRVLPVLRRLAGGGMGP